MDGELAMAQALGGCRPARRDRRCTSVNNRSAACSNDSVSVDTPLTSTSMLSAIVCAVRALPVILMTGAIGLPVGVPEAGGEDDDLRAAADHAGDRLDVEPRRVHHRQARLA